LEVLLLAVALKLVLKCVEASSGFLAPEIAMKIQFSDYDGPTGLFVATGKEILPLADAAGATAFIGAGMQAGTIDPEQSTQIQAAVDNAMHSGSAGAMQPNL
jgi:hypothetical protein